LGHFASPCARPGPGLAQPLLMLRRSAVARPGRIPGTGTPRMRCSKLPVGDARGSRWKTGSTAEPGINDLKSWGRKLSRFV